VASDDVRNTSQEVSQEINWSSAVEICQRIDQ
jgi:hypothetical protein